jgi:hypothetical protein
MRQVDEMEEDMAGMDDYGVSNLLITCATYWLGNKELRERFHQMVE